MTNLCQWGGWFSLDLGKSVQFGVEVGTKAADIIAYNDATKVTPKIIIECKKPKRKDGIEQLKSYMNAKGAPVALWCNGADSIILYVVRREPKSASSLRQRRFTGHTRSNAAEDESAVRTLAIYKLVVAAPSTGKTARASPPGYGTWIVSPSGDISFHQMVQSNNGTIGIPQSEKEGTLSAALAS